MIMKPSIAQNEKKIEIAVACIQITMNHVTMRAPNFQNYTADR